MEIILKENVIGLGYKDEIVTVKNGYGRNYLIPTGKAVIASESAKKVLAENLRQRAHKLAAIKQQAEELAEKLNAAPVMKIYTKVSAAGTIYGSVNAVHVADELAKLGFDIDRKMILVRDVKEVGAYTAEVKLHKEVSATVHFEVFAEGAEEAPAAEEEPAVEEAPVEEPVVEAEAPAEVEAPAEEVAEAPAEEA